MTDTNSSGFSDNDDLAPRELIFADDDLGRADEPEAFQVEDAQDRPEDAYTVSYPSGSTAGIQGEEVAP